MLCVAGTLPARTVSELEQWIEASNAQLLDYYQNSRQFPHNTSPVSPDGAIAAWSEPARMIAGERSGVDSFPFAAGALRGRMQQAIVVEMTAAIRDGNIERAKSLRAELLLPRGVSASEGTLLLQSLGKKRSGDAVRILTREAITWQTTRVRQLLDEAVRSAEQVDVPMPGRLMERLGEAMALADLPEPMKQAAEITVMRTSPMPYDLISSIQASAWDSVSPMVASLRSAIESNLPSLLSEHERERRERLLLKLIQLVPKEYGAGVRDGQIVVPLEYREAVTFTQQARQIIGELAPLWLADPDKERASRIEHLEALLQQADHQIAAKASDEAISDTLVEASDLLTDYFGISLRRQGTTADIVEEVMLETRTLLSSSLSAALAGKWAEAERLRVEAYTTYDPELEARLMPRDPQLAVDIERALLDGIDMPGVKVLLDRRAGDEELIAGYDAVYTLLGKATVMLKSGISPTAAGMNAASIVLREGLEGLLVIVAIFAGLRGEENAQRRRLFWVGIVASIAATAVTWALSQTLITSLRAYGEIIAAVTGIIAIGVLLLITNWLFHQVYWRQWVTTLKDQATEGESIWQLILVGFLVGYREGFETVLFLQSLVIDAGGKAVGIGVAAGCVFLLVLGIAALRIGLKLPYFRILLVTAMLIGIVLITFVGGTVRAAQTVGWLPVHRLAEGSWPVWMGNWLGLYNTWESVIAQVVTVVVVIGTWRIARWKAKRKHPRSRPSTSEATMQLLATDKQAG
jgi:high-affinity iron transporter